MPFTEPSWTVGIEEEYLLVDAGSGALVAEPPEEMLDACEAALPGLVRPEFLKAQLEVGTGVHASVAEAGMELRQLRRTVAEIAGRHGIAPIAASTHPSARWESQVHTNKERYNILARDMQAVARRLLICGMHVHVGIESDELRVDLMNQAAYFLPHLLALSTSSPFWRGELTGLKSYRLSVFNELPRTGLPEAFESFMEYERHVRMLVRAGLIEDASMLWWDVRPSARFPTLEMRITDICTRVADAVSIAAIYVCVLRMLYRLRRANQRWRIYMRMLINENRWRAQRYGLDEGLVDFGKGEVVTCAALFEELFDMIREDAEALGCLDEVTQARGIVERGTSAHRQLATYQAARGAGADHDTALAEVVRMLVALTMEDV